MNVEILPYCPQYAQAAADIWNEVVAEGVAFPQTDTLSAQEADAFFAGQSFTGMALNKDTGQPVGLYILHPNNVGRCGHICNASYAVKSNLRGGGIGETLVTDCLARAKLLGFKILQFNAVVASNLRALKLYEKLGFVQLGTIPGGFMLKDGSYEDIVLCYHLL